MSPPPIEATRCQPRARARTVTAIISPRFGPAVNQVVSPANAASAPRLRTFLPGSVSGREAIRADSFRKATTEPVKVTPPMKMPMKTSAWWMPSRSPGTSVWAVPWASTSR